MSNTDSNLETPEITEKKTLIGSKPFAVMARVALQLGRQSISNSITAIVELVKNAYDADAENVNVVFKGLGTDNLTLLIEDDGNGMTQNQLMENWLVIGTSNKARQPISRTKKRILTGEKGLGRLGLDRLCEKTIIRSFSADEEGATELVVDWHKYEVEDGRLEDIHHNLYKITGTHFKHPLTEESYILEHGTQLILQGLRDDWTRYYLEQLHRELSLLVSPFSGLNDFSINLFTDNLYSDLDGKVGSLNLLDAAEWVVEGTLDTENNLEFTMRSIAHNIHITEGPFLWKDKIKRGSNKPKCGPLNFLLYFFPRKLLEGDQVTLTRSQVTSFLNANQGVRIYRDNFRVKPYGEPDGTGDWLGLSYRRQQSPQGVGQQPLGGWRVGYNQVVGAVFISRETNPELIDQTNRENIVEGPAFIDLRVFGLEVIRFFEWNRQEFEMKLARSRKEDLEKAQQEVEKATNDSKEALSQFQGAKEEIISILGESGVNTINPSIIRKIDEILTEAIGQVDTSIANQDEAQQNLRDLTLQTLEEFDRQKNTLGNLASLGIMAATFGHETMKAANLIAVKTNHLKNDMDKGLFMVLADIRESIDNDIRLLQQESKKITTFADFTLGNVSRSKRSKRELIVSDIVAYVFENFKSSLQERYIEIDLQLQPNLTPIIAFPIDWESIIVNLITNSIWALLDTPKNKRKIRFILTQDEETLSIVFSDSGRGLEIGTEAKIFEPTFTTRRNDAGEIIGTGMGLAIVKEFVLSYEGGMIEAISPSDLGGAEFRITISMQQKRAHS